MTTRIDRKATRFAAWLVVSCSWLVLAAMVRAQSERFFPLDISPFAVSSNRAASELWSALPRGEKVLTNIPFTLREPLAVTGMASARNGEWFPPAIRGIPIGRKAKRLWLLHAATHSDRDGTPLAALVLHYANGREHTWRLGYGLHARAWTSSAREKTELADTHSQLAWRGVADAEERSGGTRLFLTALENPRPELEIARLDFVSLFSRAAPVIAGITLDSGDRNPTTARRVASSERMFTRLNEWDESIYRRTLAVQVLDARDGTPLMNATATLNLRGDESWFFFGEHRSDTRGRIELTYPPQEALALTVFVRAPGFAPAVVTRQLAKNSEAAGDWPVRLEPGQRLGGIVSDAEGQPINGAHVVLHAIEQTQPREFTRIDFETVRTDKDGRWSSASVPANLKELRLHCAHPDFRAAVFTTGPTNRDAQPIALANLRSARAIVTLPPAARVRGRVIGPNDEPVAGAEIHFRMEDRSEVQRVATSDAEGRYAFSTPQIGETAVFVLASGFSPIRRPLSVQPGTNMLDIPLPPTRPFKLHVTDSDGQPVEDATISAESWHDTPFARWRATTDADGAATWDTPPEGTMMFRLTKTNYSTIRFSTTAAGGESHWTMSKLARAFGRVIDADTRLPIREFKAIRGRAYNRGEPMRWERGDFSRGRNGEFNVRLPSYSKTAVLIEAPGYLPQASPEFTTPGWYTNEYALRKGRGLSGVVQFADGTPAAGAMLAVLDRADNVSIERSGLMERDSYRVQAASDTRGRFELAPTLEPLTVVAAHARGFVQLKAADVASNGLVVLQPWGRVRGQLRVGQNVSNQTIRMQSVYYRWGEDGHLGTPVSVFLSVDTDAQGNFAFEQVPPGWRRVAWRPNFRESDRGPTPLSHTTPVQVKVGETSEVVIGGSGRTVVGKIELADGDASEVNWRNDVHKLTPIRREEIEDRGYNFPDKATPAEREKIRSEYEQRQRAFWNSEVGLRFSREEREYVLLFETNGVFRVDAVPPGDYQLEIGVTDASREFYTYNKIGTLNQHVTIPATPADRPIEPHDLGTLRMTIRNPNKPRR